jgi:alpha-amylase
MVGWHNFVRDAPIAHWADDGTDLIAFSRDNRGWIAINNHTSAVTMTFATGLARGIYCDIIHGSLSHGNCSGSTVTVNAQGSATVTVPVKDSAAFDAADRLHL